MSLMHFLKTNKVIIVKTAILTALLVFVSSAFPSTSFADPKPSAIVFGLSKKGIQITSLADSKVSFQFSDDNFAVHTSWAGPQTGFLVNGDSVTSLKDMFRTGVNAMASLKALDANNDGVIDQHDPDFSKLKIWVDANGNGKVDPDEIYSFADLGITRILLPAPSISEATFVFTNGSTGQVAELTFETNPMESRFVGDFKVDPTVFTLPNLRLICRCEHGSGAKRNGSSLCKHAPRTSRKLRSTNPSSAV